MKEKKKISFLRTFAVILCVSLLAWVFIGFLVACILFLALLISFGVFRKDESNMVTEKIAFLTLIIIIWVLAGLFYLYNSNFTMLGFAIPLTAIYIFLLMKQKSNKNRKIAPITRFEKNNKLYTRLLNSVNIVLSVLMLALVIGSLFLVPYSKLDIHNIILLLIPQVILLLLLIINFYWGGVYRLNQQNKVIAEKITKGSSWVAIFTGNLYGFGLLSSMKSLNKNGVKVFVRRWSVQGFYVSLIVLLPFLILMLFLPEAYGVEVTSLWGGFVFGVQNIPFIQINVLLLIIMYIVSYLPFTLAGYLNEKFKYSTESFKYVSLRQYFIHSLVISALCVVIPVGVYTGASYGSGGRSQLINKIDEQLKGIERKKVVINEDLGLINEQFNDKDYSTIQDKIEEELGSDAIYKLVILDGVKKDVNGEVYISATFAGYNKKEGEVNGFLFRKYITSSNYHKAGDIELYMVWESDSVSREDIDG